MNPNKIEPLLQGPPKRAHGGYPLKPISGYISPCQLPIYVSIKAAENDFARQATSKLLWFSAAGTLKAEGNNSKGVQVPD